MKKISIILIIAAFLFPYLLIYKSFFTGGVLSWGDAPYYFPQNLNELFHQPLLWDARNSNFGVSQMQILWLYLPTFLVGFLGKIFSLTSDLLFRVVFFIPATLFSTLGSWIFLSFFVKNNFAKLIGSLLYSFNTYFLVLVDGGQIGVALAYGLFPITLFTVFSFLEDLTIRRYLFALVFLFLISNVDLRILLLVLLFIIIWKIFGLIPAKDKIDTKKQIIGFSIVGFSILALDLFWILPFVLSFFNDSNGYTGRNLEVNLISLLNSLFLYQPHFPVNEFGKISTIPFYFGFALFLIISGLLFSTKQKEFVSNKFLLKGVLIFLLFAFLAKGTSQPFPQFYQFMTDKLPLGLAFRDSSKFFIPLLLVSSILISLSLNKFSLLLTKKNFYLLIIFTYLLVLLSVEPALMGKMNGALNNPVDFNSYQIIYQKLSSQTNFFRTVWFSERPPLGYSTWDKPGLSANSLTNERPFASMTKGDYDLFGFLHSEQLNGWFKLLGVRYVFAPANERKKSWTQKDIEERGEFLGFIESVFKNRLNWKTSFPVYEIPNTLPHIFAQKKIFIVVGGEEVYKKLQAPPSFDLAKRGFVFLEQGVINPDELINLDKDSAEILLISKDINDLAFIFLRKDMVSSLDAALNQWAKRDSSEYLNWKADLENYAINTLDFDFEKGISYSTIKDEKINFNFNTQKPGKYFLGVRYTSASDSAGINLNIAGIDRKIWNADYSKLHWFLLGPIDLGSGKVSIELTNLGGTSVLNTLFLIPEQRLVDSFKKAQLLTKHFKTINLIDQANLQDLSTEFNESYALVNYKQINPTEYSLTLPSLARWIVFTDKFNPEWSLIDDHRVKVASWPFYAMINGFYVHNLPSEGHVKLQFEPQKFVKIGILLSLTSLVVILSTCLILKFVRSRQKRLK